MQDLRYGLRMMIKSKSYTAIILIILALGIGANSAIFSIVNALLLRPLPFKDPDKIVYMSEHSEQVPNMSVSLVNFDDWKRQNRVYESMGAFRGFSYIMTGGDEPERVIGSQCTAGLFTTLGVSAQLGRAFNEEEDQRGAKPVAVISNGFWKRRFASDPNIVGKEINLNGEIYTIVGVMPGSFVFPTEQTEVWTSVMRITDQPGMYERGNHPGIYVVARLKENVTPEQALTDLRAVAAQLEQQYPQTNKGNSVTVTPLYDFAVRNVRPALLALLGAVFFVLLIACANVANLQLSRAITRQREIAIRAALGAGRIRLIRQMLTESMVYALIGAGLGLLVAMWGVTLLTSALPSNTPRLSQIKIDSTVLIFNFIVAFATGLVFGIVPAIQASKADLNETLKEGSAITSASRNRQRLRSGLLVAEVSLSIVLLIGAGLLIKSFYRLQQESSGINPTNVLTMTVSLPQYKYNENPQRIEFERQLVERITNLPGVQAAGITTMLPMTGSGSQTSFLVEGQPEPAPGQMPSTDWARISPDYLRTMGITLIKGRFFTEQDNEKSQPVAIIDDTFAQKYWPNEEALGKRIKLGGSNSNNPWLTIVGVVNHVKNYGVDQSSRIETYIPYPQMPTNFFAITLRSAYDVNQLTTAVRNEVKALDKDLPVYNVRTIDAYMADLVAPRRLSMILLSVFAGLALLLASVGLYGVMSYSVSQRTREIGIRMALGASESHILRQIIGQGLRLTILGLGIGLIGALGITRLMASLLFKVEATDPMTYLIIPALLLIVGLLACFFPARKATKVNPINALRYE